MTARLFFARHPRGVRLIFGVVPAVANFGFIEYIRSVATGKGWGVSTEACRHATTVKKSKEREKYSMEAQNPKKPRKSSKKNRKSFYYCLPAGLIT